jgi:hypothetical protein
MRNPAEGVHGFVTSPARVYARWPAQQKTTENIRNGMADSAAMAELPNREDYRPHDKNAERAERFFTSFRMTGIKSLNTLTAYARPTHAHTLSHQD